MIWREKVFWTFFLESENIKMLRSDVTEKNKNKKTVSIWKPSFRKKYNKHTKLRLNGVFADYNYPFLC